MAEDTGERPDPYRAALARMRQLLTALNLGLAGLMHSSQHVGSSVDVVARLQQIAAQLDADVDRLARGRHADAQ